MKSLESQAWSPAIHLAGSILVLSVAFKNIGIDFSPVMQALTMSIANEIKHEDSDKIIELEERLKEVEKLAHVSSTNKNE